MRNPETAKNICTPYWPFQTKGRQAPCVRYVREKQLHVNVVQQDEQDGETSNEIDAINARPIL
jgi:hypothetical protein